MGRLVLMQAPGVVSAAAGRADRIGGLHVRSEAGGRHRSLDRVPDKAARRSAVLYVHHRRPPVIPASAGLRSYRERRPGLWAAHHEPTSNHNDTSMTTHNAAGPLPVLSGSKQRTAMPATSKS